ncbi:hypothetical protein QPM17_06665 [Marinobacter sp. TBZ242]|uniref:Uncharacterized protein n=1 Tax=Marinobacter azerbaijanicus TaxID=3050455 RepID=A0ABT7IAH6_9GAMM|nr:hypothetical protein [Marinobacter sp. TBZ242]MDL0430797.1 hypothetical protein [Marinobacter sp. TBZ242]
MQFRQFVVGLLMLTLPALSAWASDEQCLSAAGSELERLYCEVMAGGGGVGLPSQPDFNRNDPRVQALLLKRPAQRLGLTLPKPVQEQEPQPDEEPRARQGADTRTGTEPTRELANCQLNGDRIRCPRGDYRLADNRQRSALTRDALGPDNRLDIEPFSGNRNGQEAVRRYLSQAYDQYIAKMLGIGLGANTMSFTAFHNAFHTMEDAGVDFARRMEQTFSMLKQDRKTLGVKARYHDRLPEDLSLCTVISRDIVVCDNVGTNWVYVSPSR